MENRSILSRKSFVKLLAGICTGSFLWSWYDLSKEQFRNEDREEFRHGENISLGVSYFGKYYLSRADDLVIAFSTICTHAGCRIGKTNSNVLQCGCHGSSFDAASGNPVKGPALYPLRKLDCRFDSKSGEWIVNLQTHKESHA